MTTAPASSTAPRTYGNWRLRRGWGLGMLTGAQTWAVLVGVGLPIIGLLLLGFQALLATLPVTAVLLVIALGQWDGVPLAEAITARMAWAQARRRGWTTYQGDVVVTHQRGHTLPGVLAPLELLDAEDGRGGRQGIVLDQRTGTLTAILRLGVPGTTLADQAQIDQQVAGWGQWLASLGYLPIVRRVAVVVETAPSPGTLVDYVHARLSPTAPSAARELVAALAAVTPQAAASVDTRVAITMDPARAVPRPATQLEAIAEATRTLTGLEGTLAASGVTVLGRATAGQIAGLVRSAVDPAMRTAVARLGEDAQLFNWQQAGPVSAIAQHDHYEHDSGWSVSFALREAPRQHVVEQVLAPLLAPGPYARRVALLYEPYPAAVAAREVQSELQAVQYRRAYRQRTRRDDTARDASDEARAQRAALEEAEGAGLLTWTVYVTATVLEPGALPAAAADVEQRAGAAKLALRRSYRSQDVVWATTLGVGVDPVDLRRRPWRTR